MYYIRILQMFLSLIHYDLLTPLQSKLWRSLKCHPKVWDLPEKRIRERLLVFFFRICTVIVVWLFKIIRFLGQRVPCIYESFKRQSPFMVWMIQGIYNHCSTEDIHCSQSIVDSWNEFLMWTIMTTMTRIMTTRISWMERKWLLATAVDRQVGLKCFDLNHKSISSSRWYTTS